MSGNDGGENEARDEDATGSDGLALEAVYDAIEALGRPHLTAADLARKAGVAQSEAAETLARLADEGDLERQDVASADAVWYPPDLDALADRERVVPFPDRREVVVEHADQVTRARLSQFAHLVDANREGGAVYELREEDVWQAPFEDLEALMTTVRAVMGDRAEAFADWIERQWERARKFTLSTHEDGYTVLAAESDELMGNVARQKLADEHLRGPISDSESWVNEDATAAIKRTLYEAGYPVRDERDLESGERLDLTLRTSLRDYQREWVDRFVEQGSGVFVGPPGSGKTVAAMGVLEHVGGATLILVPSRELAGQWRDAILTHTDVDPADIGEYHGGEKSIRPITVATYRTAGMDRHRKLFDERQWGLIVYDEVQHIPADVYRRSADLQGKHRLGLTATPTREDEAEEEIFTLVGPPIGTDWAALFDAGHVAEPEVEIRFVPWGADDARDQYAEASSHQRRQLAASNPAKAEEVRYLLAEHDDAKALVFADYLDQGEALASAVDAPFVSGETPHAERARLFEAFRRGDERTLIVSRVGDEGIDLPDAELAIVASGLGGSRRQGAQRAGRTMRPAGDARVVVLATRGTREEDFVRQRTRHLASKGIAVEESDAATSGEESEAATSDEESDVTTSTEETDTAEDS